MATYATWWAEAVANGADGLGAITDDSTDCDDAYWNAHAYDQLRALFVELGAAPGSGCAGTWTLNRDNTTDDAEDTYLIFSRGIAQYGHAYIQWDASEDAFVLNYKLQGGVDFGTSATPITKIWATDVDVADDLVVDGDTTLTGTLDVTGDATVQNLEVQGTLTLTDIDVASDLGVQGTSLTLDSGCISEETPRVATTSYLRVVYGLSPTTYASLRWNDSTNMWQVCNDGATYADIVGVGHDDSVTLAMLADDVYGGNGAATTVARSDHTHTGGTLTASGTEEDTFTLDSNANATDYVWLYYQGSDRGIGIDPTGNDIFEFTKGIGPSVTNSVDIGLDALRFRHGFLSGNLDVDGTLNIAGASTLTGAVTLTGGVAGELLVNGTEITLDADAAGGVGATSCFRVPITSTPSPLYAALRWDGSVWAFTNDGSTYRTMVGTAGSQTLTDKSLTSPTLTGTITSSGTFSALATSADRVTVRSGEADGSAYFLVDRVTSGVDTYLMWDNATSAWRAYDGTAVYDLVLRTKTQTLTNKELTQPTITTGGSWSGNPSFTGNPVFSGTPAFGTATFSAQPAFNYNVAYAAPFTVGTATGVVTNLNADQVDGYDATDFLYLDSGVYSCQADIDMNGHDITGLDLTPDAHEATHLSGGADALAGGLGAVTGVTGTSWRVYSGGSTTGVRCYLGNTDDYYMGIVSTSPKQLGLGATTVAVVPGGADATQDVGSLSNRFRSGFYYNQVNLNLLSTVRPSDVANGSLWFVDGSQTNDYRAGVKVRISGTDLRLIDATNKTDMVGSAGGWSVAGDITVTGTVDSRDVATDGSKLDAIEAAADVTDATNVAAAGAVMDSDFPPQVGLMKRLASGSYSVIADSSSNWDTAYGWGNHASAGYAASGHTHSYLPLAGGTLSGDVAMGTHAVTGVTYVNFTGAEAAEPAEGDLWYNTTSNVFKANIGGTAKIFSTTDHDHSGTYADLSHNHNSSYLLLSGGTLTGSLGLNVGYMVNINTSGGAGAEAGLVYSATDGTCIYETNNLIAAFYRSLAGTNYADVRGELLIRGPITFNNWFPVAGTAPIALPSTATGVVTYLNADKVDGYDATAFATAGHNHDGTYAASSHQHSVFTGGLDVQGGILKSTGGYDFQIAAGQYVNVNGSGAVYGISKSGTDLLLTTNGATAATAGATYFTAAKHLQVTQDNKVYLSGANETYFVYDGSNVKLYKAGALVGTW